MIPDPAAQAARAQHIEILRHMRKRQEAAAIVEPRDGMLPPEVFQQRMDALDAAIAALEQAGVKEQQDYGAALLCVDPSASVTTDALPTRTVQLGVIEFHSDAPLRTRFYAVVDDLRAAGCIVDLWLMDIAMVLKEHGYDMTITTRLPKQEARNERV